MILRFLSSFDSLGKLKNFFFALSVALVFFLAFLPASLFLTDFLIISIILSSIGQLAFALKISNLDDFKKLPNAILIGAVVRCLSLIYVSKYIIGSGLFSMSDDSMLRIFSEGISGGRFVNSLILFLIIVVINLLVVGKGSSRIAEVSARFSLDSLPGKQASLENQTRTQGLISGHIEQKKKNLIIESNLLGTFDGSLKFVQGESIFIIVLSLLVCVSLAYSGLSDGSDIEEVLNSQLIKAFGLGIVGSLSSLMSFISASIVVNKINQNQESSINRVEVSLITDVFPSLILTIILFMLMPFAPLIFLSGCAIALGAIMFAASRFKVKEISSSLQVLVTIPNGISSEIKEESLVEQLNQYVYELFGISIPLDVKCVVGKVEAVKLRVYNKNFDFSTNIPLSRSYVKISNNGNRKLSNLIFLKETRDVYLPVEEGIGNAEEGIALIEMISLTIQQIVFGNYKQICSYGVFIKSFVESTKESSALSQLAVSNKFNLEDIYILYSRLLEDKFYISDVNKLVEYLVISSPAISEDLDREEYLKFSYLRLREKYLEGGLSWFGNKVEEANILTVDPDTLEEISSISSEVGFGKFIFEINEEFFEKFKDNILAHSTEGSSPLVFVVPSNEIFRISSFIGQAYFNQEEDGLMLKSRSFLVGNSEIPDSLKAISINLV